ncbi:uncharacterized protein METZ01_LOCUS22908 [marine metagenome]|uniref:Uncharacterized protein n=1 Tax=marine metagenome TaxID=408172 RepID=A0A381PTR6_9ZZZZ
MVRDIEVIEIDIDGRTFWVRPVGPGYWIPTMWWPKPWRRHWISH